MLKILIRKPIICVLVAGRSWVWGKHYEDPNSKIKIPRRLLPLVL
jgi:hypothetical protein